MEKALILKNLLFDGDVTIPAGTIVDIADDKVYSTGDDGVIMEVRYHNLSYLVSSKDIEIINPETSKPSK